MKMAVDVTEVESAEKLSVVASIGSSELSPAVAQSLLLCRVPSPEDCVVPLTTAIGADRSREM